MLRECGIEDIALYGRQRDGASRRPRSCSISYNVSVAAVTSYSISSSILGFNSGCMSHHAGRSHPDLCCCPKSCLSSRFYCQNPVWLFIERDVLSVEKSISRRYWLSEGTLLGLSCANLSISISYSSFCCLCTCFKNIPEPCRVVVRSFGMSTVHVIYELRK